MCAACSLPSLRGVWNGRGGRGAGPGSRYSCAQPFQADFKLCSLSFFWRQPACFPGATLKLSHSGQIPPLGISTQVSTYSKISPLDISTDIHIGQIAVQG